MSQNPVVYPLWLSYPKAAGIFWIGTAVYVAAVEPQIRKTLPDTRSRLSWWSGFIERSKKFVMPIALSEIIAGAFAYNETKNKFFLYGALVAAAAFPLNHCVVAPQERNLRQKANHIAQGGFLTKREEATVDA